MAAPTEAETIRTAPTAAAMIGLRCTVGGIESVAAAGAGAFAGGCGASAGGSSRSAKGFGSSATGTNLLPHFGHFTRWPSLTALLTFKLLWQSGQVTMSPD